MTKEIFDKTKGHINRETKTLAQFRRELKPYFIDPPRIPFQVALEVKQHGEYYIAVATLTSVGYDYYIPTDRKDEARLKKEINYIEE